MAKNKVQETVGDGVTLDKFSGEKDSLTVIPQAITQRVTFLGPSGVSIMRLWHLRA